MRITQGICCGAFVAGCALVGLAAADYTWELAWNVRATWLGVTMGLTLMVVAVGVVRPLLWWSRPRTAQELEAQFPQLGQRVRTVVQFSGHDPQKVAEEGVKPTLVSALEEETDLQAQPLDLREIVPRRQAIIAAALAVAPIVVLMVLLLLDWEWRLATRRAFLSDQPYTTLAVKPGDVMIDEGHDVALVLSLNGRVDRQITLLSRKTDAPDAGWKVQELGPDEADQHSSDGRSVEYVVAMDKVVEPFDYRFRAGSIQSDLHNITIRYPLTLTKFEATLAAPRYTGVGPKTVEGGDLVVIEGSEIGFELDFDRDCREACLLVSDPPHKAQESTKPVPPVRVPLEPSQDGLVATLQPDGDKLYSIVATGHEGAPLPDNQYRIRVREDQTPRVDFEDPPEAWEVNSIAEVPMRIRVNDDFGVSEAGIVFQIDNSKERGLVTKEYSTSVEPDADGNIHLTTNAALEELLCLEEFTVTETSAVTYFAYVLDNYPEKPKRAETDLRFIEIRPFQRFFKVGGT